MRLVPGEAPRAEPRAFPENAERELRRIRPGQFWFEHRRRLILRKMKAGLGGRTEASVLDLGCGDGHVPDEPTQSWRADGIDERIGDRRSVFGRSARGSGTSFMTVGSKPAPPREIIFPMKSENPLVEKLPWDSEHFGFGVGRVLPSGLGPEEAAACVSQGRQLGLRCLYFLAGGADRETWHHAIAAGFLPVGVRMELELHQPGPVSAESSHGGELASGADLPELLRLSAHAFVESRFFRDPGFPRDRAEELFRIWVSRGVGEEGFFTVLQNEEDAPAGFVTGRILEPGRGRIELVAVEASQRGRGVGARLLAAAKAEFLRRGVTTVTVVTQGSNLAAQRLYQDAGFRTRWVGIWFHVWL